MEPIQIGVFVIYGISNNWHSPTAFVWKKFSICLPTTKFAFGAKVHSKQTTHTPQNKKKNQNTNEKNQHQMRKK